MNIVILYGGRSGEHEISCLSASSVVRNIRAEHALTLIGITRDGRWFRQPQSEVERIRADGSAALKIEKDARSAVSLVPGGGREGAFVAEGGAILCDAVLPMLHGTYGEDGTVQGLLEMLGVPYAGCGVAASAITMDKAFTKKILEQAGIPVVPYVCINRHDISDSRAYDTIIEQAVEKFGWPLFVKPCSAGSSDGASKADSLRQLSAALMEAFLWDDKVLIERAVDAREIECAVTGNSVNDEGANSFDRVAAYGPGEILPTHEFYDYDAKYNDPNGASLRIPPDIDDKMAERIRKMAREAYVAVDASGLSRVDFFIDKKDGSLYLNEINTIPGFTSISMFPKMCVAGGLSYPEIIELLLNEAVSRFKARSRLRVER